MGAPRAAITSSMGVDATVESFVFEMTGAGEKLDAFIALMRPLGLAEVSRTGVVAIVRGAGSIGT